MSIVVNGKSGIRVEVVLHSVTECGKFELITFLRDYPRLVHAEDLKHRMHSNSAASSRAIPSAKMAEQLTGKPVRFGQANPGMQDKGVRHNQSVMGWPVEYDGNSGAPAWTPEEAWEEAKEHAVFFSNAYAAAGYHKQVYNRLTEPFQMIRVLTTMTETDNFYWLRDDGAADPTLAEVARCMREAHKQSVPQVLKAGQWHLPFVESLLSSDESGLQYFYEGVNQVGTANYLSLEDAIKVSCARSAATSFRNENYGLEKSLSVYDKLINGAKIHGGATEHCGTPMQPTVKEGYGVYLEVNDPRYPTTWEPGISHVDRKGNFWSGNFKGFIQFRKLIPGENYEGA